MLHTRTGAAALLAFSFAVSAQAQSLAPAATAEAAVVDVGRLPLDLNRIHRQLRQTTIREERDGLHLRYIVEVFGQAPPLVIFTREDNLASGPVPHGAPTHREIIEHITPREYRAPAADINALLRWLAERARR
ncbi:MAG: hypothetical protein HY657_13180 [Acidobacteria bacterium]|nr:hypothetical protein [Acidobacteriota bacterium]